MAFYVICDDDSKHEGMTKEQILAAITQAVETGGIRNCDTGFITKIKEKNSGGYVSFWVGTQAQYNATAAKESNCVYIITDETYGEYVTIKNTYGTSRHTVVRWYGDGIAEGWWQVGHSNTKLTVEKNGLYTHSAPATVPYFAEYLDHKVEDLPILCEVNLLGAVENEENIPLILLPVRNANTENAAMYYIASTEPTTTPIDVRVSLHMVWRWKDGGEG